MLDGYVGCILGINFPVLTRASFGIRGSYFAVFIRGVVACIWFGTQSFQGGQCLQVMISAIWPQFNSFPNHLPLNAHVTSAQLLCFFLFILIQLPLLWLHVSSLRYLFMAKTIVMPIFGLTLFIWALVAGKSALSMTGVSPPDRAQAVEITLTSVKLRVLAQLSQRRHISQTAPLR